MARFALRIAIGILTFIIGLATAGVSGIFTSSSVDSHNSYKRKDTSACSYYAPKNGSKDVMLTLPPPPPPPAPFCGNSISSRSADSDF